MSLAPVRRLDRRGRALAIVALLAPLIVAADDGEFDPFAFFGTTPGQVLGLLGVAFVLQVLAVWGTGWLAGLRATPFRAAGAVFMGAFVAAMLAGTLRVGDLPVGSRVGTLLVMLTQVVGLGIAVHVLYKAKPLATVFTVLAAETVFFAAFTAVLVGVVR